MVRDGDYIVTEGGCWEWVGAKIKQGYGQRIVDGKKLYAHRVYYEFLVGPIPEGLSLDHLCRNPPCVNPAHLEPVTHAENCRRGASAKLTPVQVAEIRSAPGTQVELGCRYGVTHNTIGRIKNGQIWASI